MQPGAPGRSSSVSERRPRRGGGGGGDGGGAAGRRHQTEPSQLERLPLAAACSSASDLPAPSAASASTPPPASAPPPAPPKQRARAMCPRRSGCATRERQSDTCRAEAARCGGGAVRRRCGGYADVQVYTGGCRWGWPAWRVIAARSPSSRHRTRGRSPRVAWGWKPRPAVRRYGATGRRRRALTTVVETTWHPPSAESSPDGGRRRAPGEPAAAPLR